MASIVMVGMSLLAAAAERQETGQPENGRSADGLLGPVHEALGNGDSEALLAYLQAGHDPNLADEYGLTLLSLAVTSGNRLAVEALIDAGADVNARDQESLYTELHNACFEGREDIFRLLLDAGADIRCMDKYGVTPLTEAAFSGSVGIVRQLRQAGLTTPYKAHVAAGLGDLPTVRKQCVDRESANESMMASYLTPLSFAANAGRADVVTYLLDVGAEPNLPDAYNLFPLHYAAQEGEAKLIVQLIRRGADPNARVEDNGSAIDFARDDAIKALLKENGASDLSELQPGPSTTTWWARYVDSL